MTAIDPGVDVFDTPPFLCIEIVSRRDEAGDLLGKIAEYAAMGVRNIWVIDPRRKKAFTYHGVAPHELTTEEPAISIPLNEVFRDL